MGVRLFLPAFVRARAHVSVFSLREKVEDAEGWCSVKSLRTVGLVLAFSPVPGRVGVAP